MAISIVVQSKSIVFYFKQCILGGLYLSFWYILSGCLKISYWMFKLFPLDTMTVWQTHKQKTIIIAYKEFLVLGICIKSKKKNIYTVFID